MPWSFDFPEFYQRNLQDSFRHWKIFSIKWGGQLFLPVHRGKQVVLNMKSTELQLPGRKAWTSLAKSMYWLHRLNPETKQTVGNFNI